MAQETQQFTDKTITDYSEDWGRDEESGLPYSKAAVQAFVKGKMQEMRRDVNRLEADVTLLQGGTTARLTVGITGQTVQGYLRGASEVKVRFTVDNQMNGEQDLGWTASVYVTQNYGTQAASRQLVGTVSPTYGDASTVRETPNLAPWLSQSAEVVDRVEIVVEADSGQTATRNVTLQCIMADLLFADAYDNTNVARVNREDVQLVTRFQAQTARLVVETSSVFGGNTATYAVENIASSTTPKTVRLTQEQEGLRRLRAWIDVNDGAARSEEVETELIVVGGSTREATLIAVKPIRGAKQWEDATAEIGVYAAGAATADVLAEIVDDQGNVTAQATLAARCAREDADGMAAEWTFTVPTPAFTLRLTCGAYVRSVPVVAEASDIEWATASGSALHLSAKGRDNSQAGAATWESNGYATVFRSVPFDPDDAEGAGWRAQQTLRLTGGASATIGYAPFYDPTTPNAGEYRGGGILHRGRTLSVKFRVSDVSDPSGKIVSCWDQATQTGFYVRPDAIYARLGRELLKDYDADQTQTTTNNRRFSAGTDVEVTITVQPLYEGGTRRQPEVTLFVNGEFAAVTNVTTGDSLSQSAAVPITLAGDGATLDIYYVRAYERCLSSEEVYHNFVMEMGNQQQMMAAYRKNNFRIGELEEGIAYCKAQSLKSSGHCAVVVTTDLREGVTSTKATDDTAVQELWIYRFKDGQVDADLSVKYVARAPKGLRVRVQGTSTAAMPKKNLRYDAKGAVMEYRWSNETQDWVYVRDVTQLAIVIDSPDDLPCQLLTTKTNYNESTATRNLPNALWVEDAVNALCDAYPQDYADLLTPPQRADRRVRQAINGVPAIQYYYDKSNGTFSFSGKVDIITDKSNMAVFGFTSDEDYSVELRSNTSAVCNFHTSDLTQACQLLADGQTAGTDQLEYRYPDRDTRWGDDFINDSSPLQMLYDFVFNCSPDHIGYESSGGVVSAHQYLTINGMVPYVTDDNTPGGVKTYTVERQTVKAIYYELKTDWRVDDTAGYRRLKFRAEAHAYVVVSSFVFNGLVSLTHLWTDQRAKNQFFTHFAGDVDAASGNDVLRLLPYDIDTSWRGDNDSRLRYDYTREYSDPGIYDDRDNATGTGSALWQLMDACFGTEYQLMYQRLVALGFYSLDVMRGYYADRQVEAYSSVIYNADTEYKYLATVEQNDGGTVMTTDQRFKAHGSALEDLDWWMRGRLYYVGGKYYDTNDQRSEYAKSAMTLNVTANAVLGNVTLSPQSYVRNYVHFTLGTQYLGGVYTDGGTTGAPIVLPLATTGNEVRLKVFGHREVRSLGDLSGLKVTSIESAETLRFVEMIIGRFEAGWENPSFYGFGQATYAACRRVIVANCTGLEDGNFRRFPVLEELDARGCAMLRRVALPVSGTLATLRLPDGLRDLVLADKPNLQTLTLEGTDDLETIVATDVSPAAATAVMDVLADIYGL